MAEPDALLNLKSKFGNFQNLNSEIEIPPLKSHLRVSWGRGAGEGLQTQDHPAGPSARETGNTSAMTFPGAVARGAWCSRRARAPNRIREKALSRCWRSYRPKTGVAALGSLLQASAHLYSSLRIPH